MNEIVQKTGLYYLHYNGQWKDQKRNGYGIQLFPNGAFYQGNWTNNKAEGFGKLVFISGLQFEGHFKRNNMLKGKSLLVATSNPSFILNLKFRLLLIFRKSYLPKRNCIRRQFL